MYNRGKYAHQPHRSLQMLPRFGQVEAVPKEKGGKAHSDGDLNLGCLLARERGKEAFDGLAVVVMRFQDAGNVQQGGSSGVLNQIHPQI